jgi:hypothetical protein
MAAISKTPSNTWKAIIRKPGWPATIKTFRTKRDAEDLARRTEDEMVPGVYINRAGADRLLLKHALDRYLSEVLLHWPHRSTSRYWMNGPGLLPLARYALHRSVACVHW